MNDIVKNNYGSLKIAFPTMRGTYMLPCTLPIFKNQDVLFLYSTSVLNHSETLT